LLVTCAYGAPARTSLPLLRDLRLPAHRLAARPKGLAREPGPSRALAPAARASSPLGDYARPEPGLTDSSRTGPSIRRRS